jgi:hypothetical protein
MSSTAWEDVTKAADEAIQSLAQRINSDPAHGVQHQQHMAIAMLYKQESMIAKARQLDEQKYSNSIEYAMSLLQGGN